MALLLFVVACGGDTAPSDGTTDVGRRDVTRVSDVDADTESDVGDTDAADDAEVGADVGADVGDDPISDDADVGDDVSDAVDVMSDVSDAADVRDDVSDTTDVTSEPDAPDPRPGDTCADAVDVSGGADFDAETTIGANDDYEAGLGDDGCPSGAASGPDRAYRITSPEARIYNVRVVPEGSFDPMIYVRRDCDRGECVDGTVLRGPGESETLSFSVLAGETVYVIVDGELFSEGNYAFDVEWD